MNRFEREFESAVADLAREFGAEMKHRAAILEPLCAHDPLVDSALVGLVRGDLSTRLLSIRLRVPELEKALGFDELALVTDEGQVLAGRSAEPAGPALALVLKERAASPSVRSRAPEAFVVACRKERGARSVGLVAAEYVSSYLRAAEKRYGLTLQWGGEAPRQRAGEMSRSLELRELGGQTLYATRSRLALLDAVRSLDVIVVVIAFGALSVALLVATLLTRGLARPVVEFAARARDAVRADPEPLPETGGPELALAARAFNQTLADLRALRDRLIVTEKIAARREVARQIAHEIKNPLSPIRSAIETLRRLKNRGAPEFEEYFDEATRTVLGEVQRINELVRSFSEYASLPTPSPTRFDLALLAREIVQLHEELGPRVSVSGPESLDVVADRHQITQVLTNLIKNAIEATHSVPNAEVRVIVRAETHDGEETSLVDVEDDGPGVPADLKKRVFEPYLTTKKEGSGLGLAISQRIAVEHGGDLTLLDGARGGALFRLSLPTAGPRLLV